MARYIPVPAPSMELVEKISAGLPEYFPRADVGEWTNGLFAASYIERLCADGKGPKTHYIGKKCVIMKEDFISWIMETYFGGQDADIEGDGGLPEELEGKP